MKNAAGLERIAVVTGANRGIGLEVCRQLAKIKSLTVVLTSRDESKGFWAAGELDKEGLSVRFLRLDVASGDSIREFAGTLRREFGRCDILVNNAGIFLDRALESALLTAEIDTLRQTMETNTYGPIMLCQALVPLMKEQHYGRVVNISSGLGQLAEMTLRYPAYRISKTALNAATRILAAEVQDENILINSMCPGWIKTDMGGPDAPGTVEQGADTAVWLATLPDSGPRGKFFRNRKEIAW